MPVGRGEGMKNREFGNSSQCAGLHGRWRQLREAIRQDPDQGRREEPRVGANAAGKGQHGGSRSRPDWLAFIGKLDNSHQLLVEVQGRVAAARAMFAHVLIDPILRNPSLRGRE